MAQVWGSGVRLEILLRTLGLSNVADTMVGSAAVRGVSGGERKRVTSAEMLVGPKASSPNPGGFASDDWPCDRVVHGCKHQLELLLP